MELNDLKAVSQICRNGDGDVPYYAEIAFSTEPIGIGYFQNSSSSCTLAIIKMDGKQLWLGFDEFNYIAIKNELINYFEIRYEDVRRLVLELTRDQVINGNGFEFNHSDNEFEDGDAILITPVDREGYQIGDPIVRVITKINIFANGNARFKARLF